MDSTLRRVAAVGTMAAAGVGVLAGTASAAPSHTPPPRDFHHDWNRHCHVEKKVTYEGGHYVKGHYVPGHWVPPHYEHGHKVPGHYVHGHYVHGYWVPGHKVVKKDVICDVFGGHHPGHPAHFNHPGHPPRPGQLPPPPRPGQLPPPPPGGQLPPPPPVQLPIP